MATMKQVNLLCDLIVALEKTTPTMTQRKAMLNQPFAQMDGRIKEGLQRWSILHEGRYVQLTRLEWEWSVPAKSLMSDMPMLAEDQPAPSPDEVRDSRTAKGGWTKATLAQWGVPWPPPRGWQGALRDRWERENYEGEDN